MNTQENKTIETDFLVIGSGIAGLSYALKVAQHGKVIIITKANQDETNTKYAQGGIAAVFYDNDSHQKHIADTLDAGAGLCDPTIVEIVVKESKQRIDELINWGTDFDKKSDGNYDLVKEGGHSENRILHHKDNTGQEIERALLQQVHNHSNISIYDYYYALDLITQHHLGVFVNSKTPNIECYGAYILDVRKNNIFTILAKNICMCSGGVGNIYEATTNPTIATGDGIAMVYRAKGSVENMEFIQFHPTSFYNPQQHPSFLVSEAVRGHGGILKTRDGKEFMQKYDKRRSLAPRDIVARAIDNELKINGDSFVLLDCRHLDKKSFIEHFPNIYNYCYKNGIDIMKDPIPVVPAAHYICGGIKVNENGLTSIKNLYAVGECASTGLHGANRLASNSLLEAVVFSHRAAAHSVLNTKHQVLQKNVPAWNAEGTANSEELVLLTQSLKELRGIMTNYVGIVRSNVRLQRAFERLRILHNETEDLYERTTVTVQLCELRNMIKVGYIIIKQAIQRQESVGLHYNVDFPSSKN
jgi:L-aspartate oxidase